MGDAPTGPRSIPGVCQVERVGVGLGSGPPSSILFEVPHGATSGAHYDAIRSRLVSALPDRLEQFFFVNTDVGAYECAVLAARMIADRAAFPEWVSQCPSSAPSAELPPTEILVVRGLVPRTFIDCNRVIDSDSTDLRASNLTAAMPSYITAKRDAALLHGLHRAYVEQASRAFAEVCGSGGLAIILHSYAPRSVGIDKVDDSIVENITRAYEPHRYRDWPVRPDVDLITETTDAECLAPRDLTRRLRARFEASGFEVRENDTYRLHPGTLGYVHSAEYRDRVLCIELNRECLAEPFTPFQQMRIGDSKVERMAAPLAQALLEHMAVRRC